MAARELHPRDSEHEATLERLRGDKAPGGALTAYRVLLNGRAIGFVWKRRGFSYRGMQGWNRGVRIRDYHPLEWRYGLNTLGLGSWAPDRAEAIRRLLQGPGGKVKALSKTPQRRRRTMTPAALEQRRQAAVARWAAYRELQAKAAAGNRRAKAKLAKLRSRFHGSAPSSPGLRLGTDGLYRQDALPGRVFRSRQAARQALLRHLAPRKPRAVIDTESTV